MASTAWEAAAAAKQQQLAAAIPAAWRLAAAPEDANVMAVPRASGLLTAEELAVTESAATALVHDLARGHVSAVAVATAFCKRAALAQQLVRRAGRGGGRRRARRR